MPALAIDVSIFFDYFIKVKEKEERHRIAREFLNKISTQEIVVYEPFIFEVELKAVLVRYLRKNIVENIVGKLLEYIIIIEEIRLREHANNIALETGCRAIDAYYIATAKTTNAILITNDRIMKQNAMKTSIKTFHLIEEYQKVLKLIDFETIS